MAFGRRRLLKRGFFLSLAIHALFLLLLFLFKNFQRTLPVSEEKKKIFVEIESLEPRKSREKRIVQSDEGERTKTPDKTAFLSDKNQKVKEETVRLKESGTGSRAKQLSKAPAKSGQPLDLSKLGLPLYSPSAQQPENRPEWASAGEGAFGTKEYVKGIKESERSALNTQEFVFYGYFHRIRQKLDLAWGPILRAKLEKYYKRGGAILAEKDYETQVLIYLNHLGSITRVQILKESGTQDLDDSAVEAFNSAGPFPNPPKAMIDQNKEVKLLWNFVLKT